MSDYSITEMLKEWWHWENNYICITEYIIKWSNGDNSFIGKAVYENLNIVYKEWNVVWKKLNFL